MASTFDVTMFMLRRIFPFIDSCGVGRIATMTDRYLAELTERLPKQLQLLKFS